MMVAQTLVIVVAVGKPVGFGVYFKGRTRLDLDLLWGLKERRVKDNPQAPCGMVQLLLG